MNADDVAPIRPDRVEAYQLSAPLVVPRRNAFGEMTHRPALIVRLIDVDGTEGWGECFCNWPPFGAAHRKQIIENILAPLLEARTFESPSALSASLTERTRSLRIQCNEPGPFEQAIAALDIAAWDLWARRKGQSLVEILGKRSGTREVTVYASALGEEIIDPAVGLNLDRGVRAFKLKVGFGEDADLRATSRLRESAGPETRMMVDANQAWTVEQAVVMIDRLAAFDLDWVEEPISAESPLDDWRMLAARSPLPLAAGENVRGKAAFATFVETGGIQIVQPDIIKWGGISGCRRVAQAALQAGRRFCPHYLGGGIGLMATAHLLASMEKDDLLEFDSSENPLIEALAGDAARVRDGCLMLTDKPGLGITPDLEHLRPFLVSR